MQKIHPMLWFDGQAEDAANFYVSVFDNSRIVNIARVPQGVPPEVGKTGDVLVVDFEIAGERYSALNGGPQFKFNEAVSFVIACENQAEVDRYWDALLADGGQPSACGWLKDKYGVSWQVTPAILLKYLTEDSSGSRAAFQAMMGMVKLDIAELERAYNQA
jgi:predicted 3-demethylubiquinone-9 3-methyltransferase (glyoxalase superfamily)